MGWRTSIWPFWDTLNPSQNTPHHHQGSCFASPLSHRAVSACCVPQMRVTHKAEDAGLCHSSSVLLRTPCRVTCTPDRPALCPSDDGMPVRCCPHFHPQKADRMAVWVQEQSSVTGGSLVALAGLCQCSKDLGRRLKRRHPS